MNKKYSQVTKKTPEKTVSKEEKPQTEETSMPRIDIKAQQSQFTKGTGSDFASEQDSDEYEIIDGERTKRSRSRRRTTVEKQK